MDRILTEIRVYITGNVNSVQSIVELRVGKTTAYDCL